MGGAESFNVDAILKDTEQVGRKLCLSLHQCMLHMITIVYIFNLIRQIIQLSRIFHTEDWGIIQESTTGTQKHF